jgi:hypothetical protein
MRAADLCFFCKRIFKKIFLVFIDVAVVGENSDSPVEMHLLNMFAQLRNLLHC